MSDELKCAFCGGGQVGGFGVHMAEGQPMHFFAEACNRHLLARATAAEADLAAAIARAEEAERASDFWKGHVKAAEGRAAKFYKSSVSLHADIERVQDSLEATEVELARLREGEGWRPMEGEPPIGRFQVRTTARVRSRVVFKALGETEIGRVHCTWKPDNDWEWRPIPDATRAAEADRDAIRDDLAEEEK